MSFVFAVETICAYRITGWTVLLVIEEIILINGLKMRFLGMAVAFGGLHFGNVSAEIYRCKLPDGTNSYQEVPCGSGKEVTTDAPFVREREQRLNQKQKDAERKAKDSGILKENLRNHQSRLDALKLCKSPTGGCSVKSIYLAGITPDELITQLGQPDSTQKIASDEIWYFMLWLSDANGEKRLRKVQVTFGYAGNSLIDRTGKVVDRTNIY